jgi:hypothetical protein
MSYYRQSVMSFFPPLTRMVKALVIVTSAAFVLTYLPARLFGWYVPGEFGSEGRFNLMISIAPL